MEVDLGAIDTNVLANWFTATTMAEWQLQSTMRERNFPRISPTARQVSMDLFRTENPFHSYERKLLMPEMFYEAHFGMQTLEILRDMTQFKFGVEVGSFIGNSAAVIGAEMKKSGGTLLCIDTWCGDINMWLMDVFSQTMSKPDGDPKIFHRFMARMIDAELTETVIPFRVSSIVGARALKVLNYEIDFVYLDSAHECGETFMELMLYWDVLRSGGVLFGDDYWGFPAVTHDVDLFCRVANCQLTFTGEGETWYVQKP